MTTTANTLPDDISRLKAMLAEHLYREEIIHQQEDIARKDEELAKVKSENERLEEMVRLLKHHRFGRKSESVRENESQLELGIFNEAEDIEEKSLMQ